MSDLSQDSIYSVRDFSEGDFEEYRSWFTSELLNQHLGPAPDQLWLEHILNDGEGCQLVVSEEEQLLAVVGICYATPSHPFQVITDISVNPSRARQGVGSSALESVLSKFELEEGYCWRAYVDEKNPIAQSFFTKNEWERHRFPDADGMIAFDLF